MDPNEIQTEREPASSKTEKNSIASACFEWMEALIPALIVIMIFFTFVFRVNIVVNGPSMEPNLMDGYKLFTTCVEPTFTRGDIVVIDAKGTSLDRRIVKRVIATEGQTVDIDFHTGIVSVDGMELDESAYIENGITKDEYDVPFPQKVPAGHVFVLGDNRTVSEDSRFSEVGMIDQRYVIGKVKFIIVPFEKFGQL
ncbi:signal peptidase I [Caproiciproducens faecalis]|uniref:signal peptidase I n=1 Tax=Caproiciproducens faecalis TaxID=2820301 RepID=UPI002106A55B|nr:signal peptidase I [Caproiciproducens faecalis]